MRCARLLVGVVALAMASLAVAGEAPTPSMADLEKALAKVPAYKFGESRADLAAAEAMIPGLAQVPAQRKQIEARFVALLGSDATADGKAFACQELSLIGSADAVPALAKLLPDEKLSHMARVALSRIPDEAAAAALRDALGKVQGGLLVGVINSLGDRADPKAVAALAKLLGSGDAAVAEAAFAALGKIGGSEAAAAVGAARAKAPATLRLVAGDAYLLCADRLVAEGKKAEAAAIYKEVYDGGEKEPLRVAAFRGLLATGDQAAWSLIIKTLSTDDPKMWGTAAQFAREIPGTDATRALAGQLAKLPVPAQVLLLGALAARGDAAALPAVLEAAKSKDESVRVAAIDALGGLGDASTVPLLSAAAASKGAEAAAARRSLQTLRGKEVDPALIAAASAGEPALRVEIIRTLASRNTASAVPALLKAAEDPDASVRGEAMNALAVLAGQDALPALVKLLVSAKEEERGTAEKAVTATCRRIEDKEAAAAPVLAAIPGADAAVRCSLLRIVGRIPSPKALEAVRAALKDADAACKDAAVRALADWPDAAPMPDLLAIARAADSPVHKVLALRGFVRMAALPSQRPADETARLFADAMALAATPDERKLVLGALAGLDSPGALDLAVKALGEPATEAEAAAAVVQIAKGVRKTNRDAAKAALEKILEVCKTPAARQLAEAALLVVDTALNIAPQGVATSPDGIESDGGAGGDQAAIDGDPATYWDEDDGKPLYRLVVTFKQPERIAIISILGYQHHQYAPKDFEILCGGKAVKKVENAQYDDNFLAIGIGDVTATTVELKITGYYGNSPAIRELGIYPPGGKMQKMETPKK